MDTFELLDTLELKVPLGYLGQEAAEIVSQCIVNKQMTTKCPASFGLDQQVLIKVQNL